MNNENVATTEVAQVNATTDTTQAPVVEEKQTIGQALETEQPKEAPKTIGLDKFLTLKTENKDLRRDLEALRQRVEEGGETKASISSDIEALATEYGVDPSFASKLERLMVKNLEGKMDEQLRPLTEKEKSNRINTLFDTHFKKALDDMPEYAQVVNPSVIKSLSLLPANASKTFGQLIEETYGNALGGKRTIEQTTARGGKEPETVDYDRARNDTAYFKEIMANPASKKQYNEESMRRIQNRI